MPLDWSPFADFVRRHERFFLTTHVRPDADGLGSLLALSEALESLGKRTARVIASRLPPRYDFMDPKRTIHVFQPPGDEYRSCDAAIVLDTGTWNQLDIVGPLIRTFTGERVVIDHHGTQDDLGATRFIDVAVESTGRLAAEAIRALGVPYSPTMASNLFVAMATDTGWFRHPSTSDRTYALAAELWTAGARPTPLYEAVYERGSLARLKLRGRHQQRITLLANGRMAWSEVRLSDFAETGAIPLDTEDFVNDLLTIDGVEVAVLFIEQRDGGAKVSFRSRRMNIAAIAEQFGGGGHKLAAGATTPAPYDTGRDRVLSAVEQAVTAS